MTTTGAPGVGLELETIGPSGKAPETRLAGFIEAHSIVTQMIRADQGRGQVRSKVKGLVDGNPPYDPVMLRNNGQAYRFNNNFREPEGFLALALAPFYDLLTEAPTYAQVRLKSGKKVPLAQADEWGAILTEEFDQLQKEDDGFDALMQLSQHEMVMFGTGPVLWEDDDDWRCCGLKSGNLLLPERSLSDLGKWELAVVRSEYPVGKLFKFIENPEAAKAVGWDVPQVRKALLNAMPSNVRGDRDWEFHQQRLRNNDLYYSAACSTVKLAHILVKEFGGKITHAIVLEDSGVEGDDDFLFKKVDRFEEWSHVLGPFYFDRGDGFHHSVKGLGIKMFGALEIKNRLKCATLDAALARLQIMLRPTSTSGEQVLALVQLGPYVQLPSNCEVIQHNLASALDGPMAVERDLEITLQSNLSQYRQRIDKPQGNPRTAYEINTIVQQSAQLGKTQLTRYYEQLDRFFAERFRRAIKTKSKASGDPKAYEFRQRCLERGVPEYCLEHVSVKAARVVGQGSAMLRQSVLSELLNIIAMLPEQGRLPLIRDWMAARVGHDKAGVYAPQAQISPLIADQMNLVALENAALKQGSVPIRSATQNDLVHADGHMTAAGQALHSLGGENGNPVEVLAFLELVGPHAGEHLQGLAGDPARKQEYTALNDQWKKLGQAADQLRGQVEKEMKAQAEQAQAAAPPEENPEQQAKLQAAQTDIGIKQGKARQNLEIKAAKARQDMAIKDAKSAVAIAQTVARKEATAAVTKKGSGLL